MDKTNATVNVPKDVLEPIIQAHVTTAINEALGGHEVLVSEAIRQVLYATVDRRGQPSEYRGAIPWIQWIMGTAVRKAVEEAIVEEMGKRKDVIKQHIAKELTKAKSPLVRQLLNGMVASLTDKDTLKYRLSVSVVERASD